MGMSGGVAPMLPPATALAQSAGESRPMGIILFTPTLELIYINEQARRLALLIHQAHSSVAAIGVLQPDLCRFCSELARLFDDTPDHKDWESMHLRRILPPEHTPVLARGFGLPHHAPEQHGRLLVLLECQPLPRPRPLYTLTDREQSVVCAVADGLTNKEIAARLGLSPGTIRTYLRRLMHKTGTTTRTGLLGKVMDQRANWTLRATRAATAPPSPPLVLSGPRLTNPRAPRRRS
jgi:DNA-binding NarL/FixJ family response regulator